MREKAELICHGREVTSPFGLLSCNENGLTFAMGYVLSRHFPFARAMLKRLGILQPGICSFKLQRQRVGDDKDGITDIEIEAAHFHAIIEAKKEGWPTEHQIQKYADELIKIEGKQLVLCALGVPPEYSSQVRDYRTGNHIQFVHLRWHEVLQIAQQFSVDDALMLEFTEKIQEVIAMQSYDSEVAIRDITYEDPTRDLYFDDLLYNAGTRGNLEPLFFAPSFTKEGTPLGMDGIQFISRVYYRDKFNVNNREAAAIALRRAQETISDRIKKLKERKTTAESIEYLESLYENWARGIRAMPKIWPGDETPAIVYFLGKAMRLPVPYSKEGGMVAPGFSLTLEELLNVEKKKFKC